MQTGEAQARGDRAGAPPGDRGGATGRPRHLTYVTPSHRPHPRVARRPSTVDGGRTPRTEEKVPTTGHRPGGSWVSGRTRCTTGRPTDVRQRGLDPAGGEVRAALAHLLRRAELRGADLPRLGDDPVHDRRVVHATVEDQAERVVPAGPRRQPVGEQQAAGLDVERQLLPELPRHRQLRRLVHLHDAAGQVPVLLVGQVAQQHAVVVVADQHLGDRALAGEEGVEQRAEALRLAERRVGRQPGAAPPGPPGSPRPRRGRARAPRGAGRTGSPRASPGRCRAGRRPRPGPAAGRRKASPAHRRPLAGREPVQPGSSSQVSRPPRRGARPPDRSRPRTPPRSPRTGGRASSDGRRRRVTRRRSGGSERGQRAGESPSNLSQRSPAAARLTVAEAGWPCQASSVASAAPQLPTPEP